jgi:NADH-quinone oxidoreductase subunit J
MSSSALFAVELQPLGGIVLAAGLGLAAVYLLLPKPRSYPVLAAGLLGLLALLALGMLLPPSAATPETVLFYAFAAIAIISGVLLITQRNPARAALSFTLVVLSTCGLFLLQAAPFLMAATIIVYAGAIIVTFLFVIMLAQQEGVSDADFRSREPLLSTFAGFLLLGTLLYVLHLTYGTQDLDGFLESTQRLQGEIERFQQRAESGGESEDSLVAEIDRTLTDADGRLKDFATWTNTGLRGSPEGAVTLRGAVERAQEVLHEERAKLKGRQPGRPEVRAALTDMQGVVRALYHHSLDVRNRLGQLQPRGQHAMSNFSGPPPNLDWTEQRRDVEGRPEMPAENTAYLGRSLFTDYLLAVEMGGTLLLVAAVGAIAIAGRRAERLPS